MRSRVLGGLGLLVLPVLLAACGDGGGGGGNKDATIAVQGGDNQTWAPGLQLPKPLQVVVTNSATHAPKKGVLVTWRVTQGAGAQLTAVNTLTDSAGIASVSMILGPTPGVYKAAATFSGNIGPEATFTEEAITGATVDSIVPHSVKGGDTLTVYGSGYSVTPENNSVLIGGIRGAIVSGTTTQLRVLVPLCLPAGTVQLTVVVGSGGSPQVPLTITGSPGTPLALSVGQVALLTDPAAINCVELASKASYLLVVENATDVSNAPFTYRLLGVGGASTASAFPGPSIANAFSQAPGATSAADDFEFRLRQLESQLVRHARSRGSLRASVASVQGTTAVPSVGDSANFNVLNNITVSPPTFTTVKAKVKLVTPHAIIYQDVNMPAGGAGFTLSDYQNFGALFDDPIYPTDTSVFGQPSDVDNNGHIIILFTPVVNGLSPKGSSSFVAGFFYGCDLLPASDCAKTNHAEIFYAAVPDPNGTVGPVLSTTRILQTTPPVLAHEFMHMIHFNQRVLLRDASDDALWMDEALAHTAEDTVGGVFYARGDGTHSIQFQQENWLRANQYLPNTAGTSLLAYTPPGTLAERGAGWLFIKYLRGRFGGGIVAALTQGCPQIPCQNAPTSVDNVTTQTHTSWTSLVSDWSVALWASGEPDLTGVNLDPRYTFVGFNIRGVLGQQGVGGQYLLQPIDLPFGSFSPSGTVLSSTSAYYTVTGPANAPPLGVSLSGARGLPFDSNVTPQLAILRYK